MFNILLFKNLNFLKSYFVLNLKNILLKYFLNFKIDEYLYCIINPIILKYKKELSILNEDYLRSRADLENYKKRSNDELIKSYKYAIEEFSENLLLILDSLESTLNDKSNNFVKLLEGVRLTLKMFINIFEKNNILPILPCKGDKFDPFKHLAISIVNFDLKDDIIYNVLQKGYIISNRVLRPALVIVNKVV